ncbi:MAG: flippase-like domain-containing protein [Flavobacteriaceae bacterium]|nr:flippase-like domain-containing protein [Flavobacteriaceae bacterium]
MKKKDQKSQDVFANKFTPTRVLLPVLIGLGVVAYMLSKEFSIEAFSALSFTRFTVFWLVISLFFMAVRDFGYMLRLKFLSEQELSWKECFRIIMLWEFTSAVTPSSIGGTGFAMIYINKEGISLGRSTAIVMATSFLDELYFIIMFPLLILLLKTDTLFSLSNATQGGADMVQNLLYICVFGYVIKFLWTCMLTYGLFYNPRGMKYFLLKVFKLPILRRFRRSMGKMGTDMVNSSHRLRSRSWKFWVKSFFATFLSWTSRYWVVNALLLAFWANHYGWTEHFVIFGRQLIMWIMMLVSPTPGGSGFAEFVFKEFLAEFIPGTGVAVGIALLWRLITYYPYLIIGAIMLPRWIKAKFGKNSK